MKATEAKLLEFMRKSPQFVIPIYQRSYSWEKKECLQLWNDIIRAGENDNTRAHFIGSIVYIEKGIYQVSSQTPLLVIDGQQRLTSISLLISALAEKLEKLPEGEQEILEGFSPRKLKNYYLRNPEEEGEKHYKLILSKTDKDSLVAILNRAIKPQEYSVRIYENYELFKKWIDGYSDRLDIVCRGIAKLVLVDIALSRDQDNPQLIFESMNSTGKELTQADLIRNYILMGLDIKEQTHLYEQFWRPMEIEFGQEAYNSDFDSFMRHYLTVKTGKIPRINEVYDRFKEYAESLHQQHIEMASIVENMRIFAQYYCNMTLKKEPDRGLKSLFDDIKELLLDVVYPLILELYDDYAHGVLLRDEFLEIGRLIESYLYRRSICSIPTNSLNMTFARFLRSIDRENYVESIKAHLILLPSYRRFPRDAEFFRDLQTRDIYNNPRRNYWFKKIENYNRKEQVDIDEYTIEHIMPQNPNLSEEWVKALGPNWREVQETWLHTVGNLTLTGYNSEYSDKPFHKKRDMENGFRDSPIRLNQSLRDVEHWNEDAIKERARTLTELASKIWKAPTLPEEILDNYRPAKTSKPTYDIDDFSFLSPSHPSYSHEIRMLFDALREKILDLDSAVSERLLKRCIAYKAKRNFVDVIPYETHLRLKLNMPFAAIHDPKERCIDVSNLGKSGNWDVEIRISDTQDLPYVMDLIKQSLEYQLGKTNTSAV